MSLWRKDHLRENQCPRYSLLFSFFPLPTNRKCQILIMASGRLQMCDQCTSYQGTLFPASPVCTPAGDCTLCTDWGLTVASVGPPEDCRLGCRLSPPQARAASSRGFFLASTQIIPFHLLLLLIFKSQCIGRSRALSIKLTDPLTQFLCCLRPHWRSGTLGFQLVWGLLVIHPTPPQKLQIAETQDAYRKIKFT